MNGFQRGDHAVIESITYDGDCEHCKNGVPSLCAQRVLVGYAGHGGGFSEFMTARARHVHRLPENISLEVGALVEPLAVAWHAVKESRITKGQSALVLGAGKQHVLSLGKQFHC